jgi:hypothetical protein
MVVLASHWGFLEKRRKNRPSIEAKRRMWKAESSLQVYLAMGSWPLFIIRSTLGRFLEK